jgi:hypothetical protein
VAKQVADAAVSEQVIGTAEGGEISPHPSRVVRPDFRNTDGRMVRCCWIHFAFYALEDSRRAVATLGESPDLRSEGGERRVQNPCRFSQVNDAAWWEPAEIDPSVLSGDWPMIYQSGCTRGADLGRMPIQS